MPSEAGSSQRTCRQAVAAYISMTPSPQMPFDLDLGTPLSQRLALTDAPATPPTRTAKAPRQSHRKRDKTDGLATREMMQVEGGGDYFRLHVDDLPLCLLRNVPKQEWFYIRGSALTSAGVKVGGWATSQNSPSDDTYFLPRSHKKKTPDGRATPTKSPKSNTKRS